MRRHSIILGITLQRKKRENYFLTSLGEKIFYRPLAKDFSTPIMEAGIAIATNASAKFGSSSIRHSDLI